MKKELGQYFTKHPQVLEIFRILTHNSKGLILEPSVGEGDLLSKIDLNNRQLITIELDLSKKLNSQLSKYSKLKELKGCFFEQDIPKISTIISNPPYVSKKEYSLNFSQGMKNFIEEKKYIGKYSTSYFFIHKSAELLEENGEMIFIVPKDFSCTTSSTPLREFLKNNGYFSHWIDCGEEKLFSEASLETLVIFRWVKSKKIKDTKTFNSIQDFFEENYELKNQMFMGDHNILFFTEQDSKNMLNKFDRFSSYFDIYVGSVSGADSIFKAPSFLLKDENQIALNYFTTGPNRKEWFINPLDFKSFESLPIEIQNYLNQNKEALLKRYKANENNWWRWSFLRNTRVSLKKVEKDKIYTFFKTRTKNPFLIGDHDGFVGSVYGIYPKNKDLNLKSAIDILNSPFYRKLYLSSGMAVGNKFQATPTAIKDIPMPPIKYFNKIAKLLNEDKPEPEIILSILDLLS